MNPESRPAIRPVDVTKYRGAQAVLRNVSFDVAAAARSWRCSAPRARANPPCCAASTTSKPSTAARSSSQGSLIGYEEHGDALLHELPDASISQQRQRDRHGVPELQPVPPLTVIENVLAGPVHVLGQPRRQAAALALELLGHVGLGREGRCLPERALRRPAAAGRDRPLAGDVALGHAARRADQRARSGARAGGDRDDPPARRPGLTLVIATHEMAIARGFADRVLFMVHGEVVEDAPSAEFFAAPRHDRAKAFLARHK